MGSKSKIMKVNRIQFDNIMARWELLKMSTAYILAETKIIMDAQQGIDTTGAQGISFDEPQTAEEFYHSALQPLTGKDKLLSQARELRTQLDNAIDNEDYETALLLQSALDATQREYDKL